MKNTKEKPKAQKSVKQAEPVQITFTEQRKYQLLAGILVLSFIAYIPVFNNGFVWDDYGYIINNPFVQSFNIQEIFSKPVVGNYHPITMITLAAEYHFLGLNETGYHAINLLFHLGNTFLVFKAIQLVSNNINLALIVTLLFGVHPLHVESVAWVSEIKDLLYTLFFLSSYILYLKYQDSRNKKFYWFSLLAFSLSLLSKAMAVSLPVVLLLTDYLKNRPLTIKSIINKVPYFLLALIFGVVAVYMQQSSHYIQDYSGFSFLNHLAFASYGFVTYLFKLLLPLDLCAYYSYPVKNGTGIPAVYYLYLLGAMAIIAGTIYSLRRTRKIFFGIGFFSITVFLVLQVLPVGDAIMADRYSYIPSIGIFYLFAEGFLAVRKTIYKPVAFGLLIIMSLFYSRSTYSRCAVWENGMSLWNDVISQYQTNPIAYYNRGYEYMKVDKKQEAIADYTRAIELDTTYSDAYNNRGSVFLSLGKFNEAFKDFDKAIRLTPNNSISYFNRGVIYMNNKQFELSIKDFSKAIELNNQYIKAYMNRGASYLNLQQNPEALNDFNKVIELEPGNQRAYHNKAMVLFNQKLYGEAIINYSKAISLKSDFVEPYYYRAMANYSLGKKDLACTDLNQALSLGYKPAADAISGMCK